MRNAYGKPNRKIWLIGDSDPANTNGIRHPLDPRHPTRHTIWTPVLDAAQETIYRKSGRRIDSDAFFIVNAIRSVDTRKNMDNILLRAQLLAGLYYRHNPLVVMTFGSFAFEFCRNAIEEYPWQKHTQSELDNWSVPLLREEFDKRINDNNKKVLPLLHQIVALKYFDCHQKFCDSQSDNYFTYTGNSIGQRLLRTGLNENIWLKPDQRTRRAASRSKPTHEASYK